MASLSDVAKAAGVSLTTASMVLNRPKQPNRVSSACAQRVRDVAEKLDYIPNYHARSMKLGRAEAIAVAMDIGTTTAPADGEPTVSEFADGYFNQLLGGIELHLRSVGYQMVLVGSDDQTRAPRRALEGLRQRRFDGMIVLCAAADPASDAILTGQPDAPIVAIEYHGETDLPVIDFDAGAALALAAGHLSTCKHNRLLWIGKAGPGGVAERERLFTEAASKAGMSVRPCHFNFKPVPGRADRVCQLEQARAAMRNLLAQSPQPDFTAVVASNDAVALGAVGAIAETSLRVPRDISVIGFDDVEGAYCIPALTTVSHRLPDLGRRAAEWVMEMVTDESARKRLRGARDVLQPELVIRESTGPARRSGNGQFA